MKLTSKIINDEYTEHVYKHYDIQNTESVETIIPDFEIPDGNWNIGLIYGKSGSGKTKILESVGIISECEFDPEKPLISNFDHVSPQKASRILAASGLGSVPTWLKPYRILSNGEKYRARLAYLISKSTDTKYMFIDEYTSVVDRTVAKSMSVSLSKMVHRMGNKVVLASCHDDIIEWLQPNWIFYVESGQLVKKKSESDQASNYKYSVQNMMYGNNSKNITI